MAEATLERRQAPDELLQTPAAQRKAALEREKPGAAGSRLVADLRDMEAYDEADDLRVVAAYLKIDPTGAEMRRIMGLPASSLSDILKGRIKSSRKRKHTAIVGALVRELQELRSSTTGSPDRGKSAIGWLHSGRVTTSAGIKTPIEVLSDDALAEEALAETRAALYR